MNDVMKKLKQFKEDVMLTMTNDGDETRWKIVNSIVRDRILFYIAENYDTNFWYLMHYYKNPDEKPSTTIIEKIQTFIDDGLSYEDIRTYYYADVAKFKKTLSQPKDNGSYQGISYIAKPKQGNQFFSINERGITLVDKENATFITCLMDKQTTMNALKLSKSFDGVDDFILIVGNKPEYHLPSKLVF